MSKKKWNQAVDLEQEKEKKEEKEESERGFKELVGICFNYYKLKLTYVVMLEHHLIQSNPRLRWRTRQSIPRPPLSLSLLRRGLSASRRDKERRTGWSSGGDQQWFEKKEKGKKKEKKKERCTLPWETWYRVVLGLASTLVYLHEEGEQCVVHKDVKSSNVMLDSNVNAKLGDSNLARLVDRELDLKSTAVAGTDQKNI
ncbi:serine/threonine receptor protein kinase STK2 [Canna indica]|uniref:Serine/threonine receptor protein kinase STK2 n=1 Tax=Canna indica TaxID=4628 RepID=A0AAQ3K537_9LILI|nr:serine/threonine receptor protein kinase STK2 [Canna indica]